MQFTSSAISKPLSITFAFVATHNHFVLDRGGKVFNRSAPVIKLPEGATEDDHLALLGVLNSSTACFWLKQNSHNKGTVAIGGGIGDDGWETSTSSPAPRFRTTRCPACFRWNGRGCLTGWPRTWLRVSRRPYARAGTPIADALAASHKDVG